VRDIVVIGAGPAGSIAAARLAERGHDVVMLEEHEDVGRPVHCTGLLGEEAFDEFRLPRALVLARATAARFWGTGGESFSVKSDRVRAAIIDRAALDALLADRAVHAGAELRRGWRAQTITVGPGGVTVTALGAEPVVARACVLACGANYRFHRPLGLGRPGMFLQSAQLEMAFPALPGIDVRFGRDVAPGGFAWLVSFDRGGSAQARIGLMSESRARTRFLAFLQSLYARAGQSPDVIPEPRLKMLPLGPVARTFADRVLAVGDAAGLVKPTTGGGIYYGMLSGGFAADVLDEGLERDRLQADSLKKYEARWQQRLGSEIRMGAAFRRIAQDLSDEAIDALIALGRANGVVPILQRTASFNWHRKAAMALLGHPSFRRIVLRGVRLGSD
jgi:digeranylgeranylglycerophospholipid reductase